MTDGLRIAFSISVALALIAALASLLRGKRYIYEQESQPQFDPPELASPASWKENKGKKAQAHPAP